MFILLRVILFLSLLVFVEYYFTRKLFNSIEFLFKSTSDQRIKQFKKIFLFYINLYPLYITVLFVYALSKGFNRFVFPEGYFLDYFLIYPFWILMIIVLQSVLFFLLFDTVKLFLLPLGKNIKQKLTRAEHGFVIIIVSVFLIYVPSRILYDYYSVDENIVTLSKENLSPKLNDFKIVFISDLQADRYTDEKRLNNFINKVNKQNAHLVLVAGDFITSTPNYIYTAAKLSGKIKSKYGIYACIGDHDNWAYRWDNKKSISEIISALAKNNIRMIDNGRKVINVNGARILITFITNTYVDKISDEKLDGLFNGYNNFDYKIVLTHQPRENFINLAIKHNYDLFLAGHTHGGQISFLFPFKNLSPTLLETKYVKGVFKFNNLTAIVTRGLGMSIAPVRYNSTPEITIIKLKNLN